MSIKEKKSKIYFQKEGMTSILYNEKIVPVTVLSLLEQEVLQNNNKKIIYVKTKRKMKKPQKDELFKIGKEEVTHGEIKSTTLDVGQISIPFQEGEFIDVTAKSKGKGFAGVMKRWNFKGGRASHGASLSHRSGGSTGCRQDPGKTGKGKKMAGHLGATQVTQQNLKVLKVITVEGDKQVLMIFGSVPGPKKQVVAVSSAIKRSI